MKYLLDTDHISFLQLRAGAEYVALAARMRRHSPTDYAFSLISFHEQVLGANVFINRARTPADTVRGYSLLLEILQGFSAEQILTFDVAASAIFDQLRGQRVRIATMDLRIASIALLHGLILLTRNTSDFSKVPGLLTEDWTN